jgi:hypothetical protein
VVSGRAEAAVEQRKKHSLIDTATNFGGLLCVGMLQEILGTPG